MATTRTLNPLPFEHLEPKRFEDLVRQLIYDFRPWRILEATGRSGGDDGFDARGIEVVSAAAVVDDEADGDDGAGDPPVERVWLIQCKREKEIGPAKMVKHLEAIPAESLENLYGLVLAAACDMSKATRDACREWCRASGVQEVHIWGRGEIEDQLFQPKNDNLLFAYFGISLQIRRQGVATRLRRRITLKRRIRKIQEHASWPGAAIILRDPADDRYPDVTRKGWDGGQYRWRPAWSRGAGIHGLRVVVRQHYGYYDYETEEWDIASGFNHIYPHEADQLWPAPALNGALGDISSDWMAMPKRYQVHFRLIATIPYEDLVEIDTEPDDFCELPTVFTTFRQRADGTFEPPFLDRVTIEMEASSAHMHVKWVPERHVQVFPEIMRDTAWETEWAGLNGFSLSSRRIDLPVDPTWAELRARRSEDPAASQDLSAS